MGRCVVGTQTQRAPWSGQNSRGGRIRVGSLDSQRRAFHRGKLRVRLGVGGEGGWKGCQACCQGLVLTALTSLDGSALLPLVLPPGISPPSLSSPSSFPIPLEPQPTDMQYPISTLGLVHSARVGFGAPRNKMNILISFAEGCSIPKARSESPNSWVTKRPHCSDEKNKFLDR